MGQYKHKDKKRGWFTRFMLDGEIYKKEGFQTKSEAAEWEENERYREKHPEQSTPKTIPLTFAQVSNKYLETYSSDFHQKNTYRQKAFVFRTFITFHQQDPAIEDLSPPDFAKYLKVRKDANNLARVDEGKLTRGQKEFLKNYSFLVRRQGSDGNKAANRDLKEFKALFAWANRQTIIQHNPVLNLEPYPEEETQRYIPPVEDIDRVILAATDWELDLIQTVYHTLGRLSEILSLTWRDVNLERRNVTLRTRKRRGGQIQSDHVPMSETLHRCLRNRWIERDKSSPYVFTKPDGGIYTKNDTAIRGMMAKLCKEAGVRKFGFHAIRHHVAMILEDSGKATLREIQRMLRHNRPTTTDNYLKGLSPSMKQVANILDKPKKSHLKVVEKTESQSKI
jgi:integrase